MPSSVAAGLPATPLENATNELAAIIRGPRGCSDPGLPAAALAFQQAWNDTQTTQVPLSSQYDYTTSQALQTAITAIGGDPVPGPCALQPVPAGTSPAAAPTGTPLTLPTTTLTTPSPAMNWAPVVIVGAVGIAAGLVAWGYMSRKPRALAAEEHGARFHRLERELARRGDVDDPKAVAAAIGRRKYGKKRFERMAARGRKA